MSSTHLLYLAIGLLIGTYGRRVVVAIMMFSEQVHEHWYGPKEPDYPVKARVKLLDQLLEEHTHPATLTAPPSPRSMIPLQPSEPPAMAVTQLGERRAARHKQRSTPTAW